MKIKKGDNVRILTGKDRGKSGKVVRAFPKLSSVIIEGINMRTKHTKTNRQTKQGGGITTFAAPLPVSNVAVIDPKTNKPTRVGSVVDVSTKKRTRVTKASGTKLS